MPMLWKYCLNSDSASATQVGGTGLGSLPAFFQASYRCRRVITGLAFSCGRMSSSVTLR